MPDREIAYDRFARIFNNVERAVKRVEWLLMRNPGSWETGALMMEEINSLRLQWLPPNMLPPGLLPPEEEPAPDADPAPLRRLRLVISNEGRQS